MTNNDQSLSLSGVVTIAVYHIIILYHFLVAFSLSVYLHHAVLPVHCLCLSFLSLSFITLFILSCFRMAVSVYGRRTIMLHSARFSTPPCFSYTVFICCIYNTSNNHNQRVPQARLCYFTTECILFYLFIDCFYPP